MSQGAARRADEQGEGRAGCVDEGSAGSAVLGSRLSGRLETCAGVVDREELGAWRGGGIDCSLLSPPPKKTRAEKSLNFLEVPGSVAAKRALLQRFPRVISTFFVRDVVHRAGLGTCKRGGVPWSGQRKPKAIRTTAEMPPPVGLAPLQSPHCVYWISEARPARCGSLTDSWACMQPLFSGRADKEQGTYWSLYVDSFPLHTLFQVGDFSEKEVWSSWAEV